MFASAHKPVTVIVTSLDRGWQVILVVEGKGDPKTVAAKLRSKGATAWVNKGEVLVDADKVIE